MKKAHRKVHLYLWLLLFPLLLLLVVRAMEGRVDPMPATQVEQQQQGGRLP